MDRFILRPTHAKYSIAFYAWIIHSDLMQEGSAEHNKIQSEPKPSHVSMYWWPHAGGQGTNCIATLCAWNQATIFLFFSPVSNSIAFPFQCPIFASSFSMDDANGRQKMENTKDAYKQWQTKMLLCRMVGVRSLCADQVSLPRANHIQPSIQIDRVKSSPDIGFDRIKSRNDWSIHSMHSISD